jgi:hypothetical protein
MNTWPKVERGSNTKVAMEGYHKVEKKNKYNLQPNLIINDKIKEKVSNDSEKYSSKRKDIIIRRYY